MWSIPASCFLYFAPFFSASFKEWRERKTHKEASGNYIKISMRQYASLLKVRKETFFGVRRHEKMSNLSISLYQKQLLRLKC